MSKQSEMEEIEYESSVSSNLSFLEDQPIKKSDKSDINSPLKTNLLSKLQKELKDKGSSKQGSNEEGNQADGVEKEKQSLAPQINKNSENKVTEKQVSQEVQEPEHAKKKEDSKIEMEEEQPVEEQEEVEDANIEEEGDQNNQQKESDEDNDEDKDDDDKDDEDEEDGQEGGNSQKESKENDKNAGAHSTNKKKGLQQSSSASQKKTQQKGKVNSSSSNAQNPNASKQTTNQASSSSNKQNTAKLANSSATNSSKQQQESASTQSQKLNQKRNMAQRQLEEDQPKANQSQQTASQSNSASNGNQAASTQNSTPQASQSAPSQQQPPKPVKKLSSKFYLYKEGVKLPDLSEQLNQTIEVRVSKEYIHRFNKQYLSRNIWGSENYTSDSDIVCILIHHGFVKFDQPELQKDSKYAGVQVTFTVSKNRKGYSSQEKNSITSRPNKAYSGYTIKPNSCNFITTLGSQEDLNRNAALMCTPAGRKKIKPNYVLQPRNILPIPEVNITFNLSNDPAYKYSIVNFCDKSDESKDWITHKLQTHALYIENDKERYEISRVPEGEMNLVNEFDAYKFSRVKDPLMVDNEEMQKQNIPLSADMVELIHTDLDWSDFKWGSNVLIIKEIEIKNLKCFKFYIKNQVD